ncbi:MAG: hypothetical protein IJK02_01360 [Clostridia bacterium]|nr:hypothetical protein [Clostridia bacterium]MBR0509790.1 hypothetical protein [Clostridia bacterium]
MNDWFQTRMRRWEEEQEILFSVVKKCFKSRMFVGNIICVLLCVLALTVSYFVASPPRTDNRNIRCDHPLKHEIVHGVAMDQEGNYYFLCGRVAVCYDADFNYLCAYSDISDQSADSLFISHELMEFEYARGGCRYVYRKNGEFVRKYAVEKHTRMSDRFLTPDGEEMRFHRLFFIETIRDAQGKTVWRRFSSDAFFFTLLGISAAFLILKMIAEYFRTDDGPYPSAAVLTKRPI